MVVCSVFVTAVREGSEFLGFVCDTRALQVPGTARGWMCVCCYCIWCYADVGQSWLGTAVSLSSVRSAWTHLGFAGVLVGLVAIYLSYP